MKTRRALLLSVIFISVFICLAGCARNVDEIKQHAETVFESNGFEVVGYQGYQLSMIFGGFVWYTLEKGNITYEAAIAKWFDEYHIYNLNAIDAIKPQGD